MSYKEIPFEEKAVQLIPEDFEILSEYSWDMTGYTSRFGFFYLGTEKADVEGLTRWQAEHIFQLTPIPPGMEDAFSDIEKGKHIGKEKKKEIVKRNEVVGDTYIAQAVQEKNLRYLSQVVNAEELSLRVRLQQALTSYFWTNLLRGLTQSLLVKSKIISVNCLRTKVWAF